MIGRLKELKESRGKNDRAIINFLMNFAESAYLTHKCLPVVSTKQILLQQLKRSYLISLVTSLETFYRDLLVQAYTLDSQLLKKTLKSNKQKVSLGSIHNSQKIGIGIPEWIVLNMKFQSLKEIESALNPLFSSKDYLTELESYKGVWSDPGVSSGPVRIPMPEGWRKDFFKLFQLRHRFVHDGNSRCNMSNEDIFRIEHLVLLIAQTTAVLLRVRIGKGELLVSKDGFPAFMTIKAILIDKWALVDEK